MDVREARAAADQLLGNSGSIGNADRRMDAAALALTDTNHDFRADREEIVDALVRGRIAVANGKAIPAVNVAGTAGAAAGPQDAGLAPTPFFHGTFLPGGDPSKPWLATNVVGAQATTVPDGSVRATLTDAQIDALKGRDFATVSAQVRTPADVARFLARTITYDDGRLSDAEGNYGSWSSAELLERGTGVCRDQHALARDLLVAAGYRAELYGYAAADQSHAVTLFQDPQSGKWGMVEYGTVYPPSQLQANTPEEALLRVRPATLSITHFTSDGPNQRSHVDGILYTPTSRVYEQFMAGPSPNAGTGVQVSTTGVRATVASDDRRWQAGMQIVTDPRLPYLQGAVMVGAWHNFAGGGFRVGVGGGYVPNNTEHLIGSNVAMRKDMGFAFVSAEEFHPELLRAENVGGTGINVTVGSQARAQAMVGTGMDGAGNRTADFEGTAMGTSSFKWTPTLTIDRRFDVDGDGRQETRTFATYGLGVDGGLLGAHYVTGGRGLPITQYVTAGVETTPVDGLRLSAQGYMPITNFSNDFAAKPLVRVEAATPWLRVGTTQGADQASYDATASVQVGKHVELGAFGRIDQDRRTNQTVPMAGVQLNVVNF